MSDPSTLPYLSLTPHTPSTLPTDPGLFIQAATQLLASFDAPGPSASDGWKPAKTHDGVETFSRKKQTGKLVGGDAFWAARRSVHPQADYHTFKVSPPILGDETTAGRA